MAERRMFAKTIIDSDLFLDMPLSTQCLYFHLSLRADDDGFINNPKKVQRMVGNTDDDLKLLIAKNFIIPFESGVVVIKHWKIHNYIQKDRYKETLYKDEKLQLSTGKNKEYILGIPNDNIMDTKCIHDVSNSETQVRLGQVRLGQVRLGNNNNMENYYVVVDKIKSYFFDLTDEELGYIFKTFKDTKKDIDYLEEKLILAKNTDCKSVVGFLIKAIKEDYEPHKNNVAKFKPQTTRFHYNAGNESFKEYEPDELEAYLLEGQKEKWQKEKG